MNIVFLAPRLTPALVYQVYYYFTNIIRSIVSATIETDKKDSSSNLQCYFSLHLFHPILQTKMKEFSNHQTEHFHENFHIAGCHKVSRNPGSGADISG